MSTATLPAPASPQTSADPAPTRSARSTSVTSPSRILAAIAHLGALGIIGPLVLATLGVMLMIGVALIPFLLVGVVMLAGLVYVFFGVAWIETARVDGLYDLGLDTLRVRTRTRGGFGGVIGAIGRQSIDGRMWRGLAHLTISAVLGAVVLGLIGLFASAVAIVFSPLYARGGSGAALADGVVIDPVWGPVVGILSAVLAVAALVGIGALHGVLARAILVPSREGQLEEAARASQTQRAGAVRAAEVERSRIERDLHDGVQPRLVSIGMTLGLAQEKIDSDPETAKAFIAEAHTSTKAAITDLRQLARGIHTSVLEDRGLDAALSALAGRSHIPVSLDVRVDGRCDRAAEAAMYFSIAEALTNAAKHSRASECRVIVRVRDEGVLWARVEDNGIGGAVATPGGGLEGITNRVLAAGGTTRIDSPLGGPTTLEVSVPCAS